MKERMLSTAHPAQHSIFAFAAKCDIDFNQLRRVLEIQQAEIVETCGRAMVSS